MEKFRRKLQDITPQDQSWSFAVDGLPKPTRADSENLIKFVSVTSNKNKQEITLSLQKCAPNRVTASDPLSSFIHISFSDFRLRVPSLGNPGSTDQATPKESSDYITRLLQNGVKINGVQYHFFGHSNSQLKSRSCYLFAASKDEVSLKVESLGDFSKIKSVAKKAKRIGLLFSVAEMGVTLPPNQCEDIPDIQNKESNFTDGCGLIATSLAKRLVKAANVHFRNKAYLPSVFQIRYRGYKGVLTLEPTLKGEKQVRFRDSMRKFNDVADLTLSVVDYSKPYSFGYLNDEIILQLHALGISSEMLASKQLQYIEFLSQVRKLNPQLAFQFLCFSSRIDLAERLLMEGVESVQSEIRKLVKDEQTKMINKRGEHKSRIFLQKSRLLFGVCDPYGILKEGQCFVRVTADGDGEPRTIVGTEVLVTRNPLLHPGDLRKLKAVDCPELSYLVDCIVFATRGKRATADLMSGGDLDGDKFFVCWDSDIIPSTISEPAEYPAAKEPVSFGGITDDDRIKYFAEYTSVSLGQVKNLYLDWARLKGPMSAECQQLNRLFSQCVDGNRIKIPDHFKDPPKPPLDHPPFILDVLHEAAKKQLNTLAMISHDLKDYSFDALELLLSGDGLALSEFELIQLALRWCDKNHEDFSEFAPFFNFNSLNDDQKACTLTKLPITENLSCLVMNGLMQSNIVGHTELMRFGLHHPGLRWKRVFDSNIDRMDTFLASTSRILEDFHKKLIVLQIDERLSVAIYVPRKIEPHKECTVDNSVRVFAFPHSQGCQSSNYVVVPTKVNYRLFCDSAALQLYQAKRANTWVFLQHGPLNNSAYRNTKSKGDRRRQKQETVQEGSNSLLRASIALDKINKNIQTHVGRVNRTGVLAAEVYVISNRDVKSLQKLDEWLNHIDTQETLSLFEQDARLYTVATAKNLDWTNIPDSLAMIARDGKMQEIAQIESKDELTALLNILLRLGQRTTVGIVYRMLLEPGNVRNLSDEDLLRSLIRFLPEVPWLSRIILGCDTWQAHRESFEEELNDLAYLLLNNLVLSANRVGNFIMEPFQIILREMKQLLHQQLSELVELIALTAPSAEFAMKLLLEILDPEISRLIVGPPAVTAGFAKQLFGIALEHADETDETKKTKNMQTQLLDLVYKQESKGFSIIECKLRIDAKIGIRMGDHVRLTPATPPNNAPVQPLVPIDAIVETVDVGIGIFRCLQSLPEYLSDCSWTLLNCGSFTSSKTMIDAVSSLYINKTDCCRISDTLTLRSSKPGLRLNTQLDFYHDAALNASQNRAIEAVKSPVSLLWGPPGTGKTRTVVAILHQLLVAAPDKRILVAAPTHNAVDNILRKFIELGIHALTDTVPIRVSTDVRKVAEDLKPYTCDAMLGKDLNANFSARNKAQKRIKQCRLAFTTCIGANLGLLRGEKFSIVIIDEASQQTEATTIVPLVKGCERAVLVGDHVQLRSTVGPHAKAVDFDISLFERMYAEKDRPDVKKVMLDTQYRMHHDICSFSSKEFYGGRLATAVTNASRQLPASKYPWPVLASKEFARMVFMQCSSSEDLGQKSKSNPGQASLCREVCSLLATPLDVASPLRKHSVVILTGYNRQIELLQRPVIPGAEVFSVDGFQGREADIVIFLTVRCNQSGTMGFLTDMRRLNVALTRAKAGLIIIGDQNTLIKGSDEVSAAVWGRLIASCSFVTLATSDAMK